MTVLADHTVLPPDAGDGMSVKELTKLLDDHAELNVVSVDGRSFALTGELREVLVHAGRALSHGQAVTVEPRQVVLSTQGAADLLGVSRPTVVKLLQAGEIPFTQPGRHRRIQLEDVLEYQRRIRSQRRDALATMSADAADDDAYGRFNGFTKTR